MPAPLTQSAITASWFAIVIDDAEIAVFTELVGVTSEVVPVDLLQSGDSEVELHEVPGKRLPPTITLTRGMSTGTEMWAWHEAVVAGDLAVARKDCSLVMYGTDGKVVARYHLEHAWPAKLAVVAREAGTGQHRLTETATFVCEHIQRIQL